MENQDNFFEPPKGPSLRDRLKSFTQRFTHQDKDKYVYEPRLDSKTKGELEDEKSTLMEQMWSDPDEKTQQKIRDIETQLESRFDVVPLHNRLDKDDPESLEQMRQKLVNKMLSDPDEETHRKIREIDQKRDALAKTETISQNNSNDVDWNDTSLWETHQDIRDTVAVTGRNNEKKNVNVHKTEDPHFVSEQELSKLPREIESQPAHPTMNDLDDLLKKYESTVDLGTDEDLEQASEEIRALLEKNGHKPLSAKDAELMLLVQNAKLKELTLWVTEYTHASREPFPPDFWTQYYKDKSDQISNEIDAISQNVKLDSSNHSDGIEFINKYAALEKQLVVLRSNFVKNNFSGEVLSEQESKIESEIADLWKKHEEKNKSPKQRQDEEQQVMRNAQVLDQNAREGLQTRTTVVDSVVEGKSSEDNIKFADEANSVHSPDGVDTTRQPTISSNQSKKDIPDPLVSEEKGSMPEQAFFTGENKEQLLDINQITIDNLETEIQKHLDYLDRLRELKDALQDDNTPGWLNERKKLNKALGTEQQFWDSLRGKGYANLPFQQENLSELVKLYGASLENAWKANDVDSTEAEELKRRREELRDRMHPDLQK